MSKWKGFPQNIGPVGPVGPGRSSDLLFEPLREGATSVDDGALLLISEVQLIGPGSGSFVTIPILGPEL